LGTAGVLLAVQKVTGRLKADSCGIPTAHEGKNPRIHSGLLVEVPGDEYSRIERNFRFAEGQAVDKQQRYAESMRRPTAHERKNPKILRGLSPETSLRRLRED